MLLKNWLVSTVLKKYPRLLFYPLIYHLYFQYGGDATRRYKLLSQQKEGKKKMRMIGKVEIPRDAFIQLLKR